MTKVQMITKQIWVMLLLLLAACTPAAAQPDGTEDMAESEVAQQLIGTDWNLVEWTGMTIVPNTTPTIAFNEDGLNGTTGCNSYFGSYTLDGNNLTVSEVGMTEMFCEGIMEQEQAFVNALVTAESLTLSDDSLTIHTAEGDLTFQPPTQATLTDTIWILSGIAQGDAVSNTQIDSEITAEFKDGQIGGSSGCNSYSAPYEVEGSNLTLGQTVSTLMACEDEARNQRESEFLTALAAVARYEIQRNTLSLSDAEGQLLLTFEVQES